MAITSELITIGVTHQSGFIFDMDGTIVDNMAVHHAAWQETLRDLGKEWEIDEVQRHVWGKNEDIFERIFPGCFSKEQVQEISLRKEMRYIELYRPSIAMLPGLETLLASAQALGVKVGIATAAPKICVDFVYETLRLDRFFHTVVHADEVERSKPFPDTFLIAAERLGVSPSRCTVFEDAPVGVKAAEAAGMESFVVLTTHKEEEFCDFRLVRGVVRDFTRFRLLLRSAV